MFIICRWSHLCFTWKHSEFCNGFGPHTSSWFSPTTIHSVSLQTYYSHSMEKQELYWGSRKECLPRVQKKHGQGHLWCTVQNIAFLDICCVSCCCVIPLRPGGGGYIWLITMTSEVIGHNLIHIFMYMYVQSLHEDVRTLHFLVNPFFFSNWELILRVT